MWGACPTSQEDVGFVLEHWPSTEEAVKALRKAEIVPTVVLVLQDESAGEEMRQRTDTLRNQGFYYDHTRECKLEVSRTCVWLCDLLVLVFL